MKKGLKSFGVALLSVVGLVGCGTSTTGSTTSSFKAGFILVGDENEGYSMAHIEGIKSAASKLGLSDDQIIMKKKIEENDAVTTSAKDLISSGCKLVVSNSYGHQDYMAATAQEYSNVQFVADTGDFAAISGIENLSNAFTSIYEARYVSGIVGGMKLKELIDGGKLTSANMDANGNYKIGYVGAYEYAEVISGYTAFFLGVQSIVPNITMDVKFTYSWFDIDKEGAAAQYLVGQGAVIIGQHADSTGAPAACEDLLNKGKVCYSVGYNVDMLSVAPNAALTSATNNWEVYYEYVLKQAMEGKEIATDWAKGYSDNAVGITALGTSCAEGTAAKVTEAETAIKNGTLKIFDTSKFTVDGQKITSHKHDFSYYDYSGSAPKVIYSGETKETIKTEGDVSYVEESVIRSAPYFDIKIDGINWVENTDN